MVYNKKCKEEREGVKNGIPPTNNKKEKKSRSRRFKFLSPNDAHAVYASSIVP
jgi:hypothetical protein